MVLIPPVRRRSVLLAGSGRAAGMARRHARVVAAGLVASWLLASMTVFNIGPTSIDPSLHDAIVDGVRHGARFYDVAVDAERQTGLALTAWSVPLPSLALVTGFLSLAGAIAMFWTFGVVVVIAWWERLRALARGRAGRIVGTALVAIGVAGVTWPTLVTVPGAWAGLLVALSLARWRTDAPVEGAAFGLAAAVIAPGALAYLGIMTTGALMARQRRDAMAWAVAGAIGLAVLAGHAHALAAIAGPPDMGARDLGHDPARLLAPAFASQALSVIVAAASLPPALVGWASWRDPLAPRVLALIGATALLAVAGGQASAGLIAAPLLPLGLLALPDLIGDLAASALDRRRITVTRMAR